MPGQAYKRYYEKNREQILSRMKERNAERRRAVKEEAFKTPDGVEAWREENRERYYRSVESKTTKQLNVWMNDPDICDTFKKFLKECLWAHKGKLTPGFVATLGQLSIANAFGRSVELPDLRVDGDKQGEAESQAEA